MLAPQRQVKVRPPRGRRNDTTKAETTTTPHPSFGKLATQAANAIFMEQILMHLEWKEILDCARVSKHINKIITTSKKIQLRLRRILHQISPNRARDESLGQQLDDIVRSQSALSTLRPYAVTYYDPSHALSEDYLSGQILSGGFLLTFGTSEPHSTEKRVDSFLITDLKTVGDRRRMIENTIGDQALYGPPDHLRGDKGAKKAPEPTTWLAKIEEKQWRVAINAEDNLLVLAAVKPNGTNKSVTASIRLSFHLMIPDVNAKGSQDWQMVNHPRARKRWHVCATQSPGARVKQFEVKIDGDRVTLFVHFGVSENDEEKEERRTIVFDWKSGRVWGLLPKFSAGGRNPPLPALRFRDNKQLFCMGRGWRGLGLEISDDPFPWSSGSVDLIDLGNVGKKMENDESDEEEEEEEYQEITDWDFGIGRGGDHFETSEKLLTLQWDRGFKNHLGLFSYSRWKGDQRDLIAGAFADLSDPVECDAIPLKNGSCAAVGPIMVTLNRDEDLGGETSLTLAITNYDSNAVKSLSQARPRLFGLGKLSGSSDIGYRRACRKDTAKITRPLFQDPPLLWMADDPDLRTFNKRLRSPCGSHWEKGLPNIIIPKVEVSVEMRTDGNLLIGDVLFDGQMIVIPVGEGYNILYF